MSSRNVYGRVFLDINEWPLLCILLHGIGRPNIQLHTRVLHEMHVFIRAHCGVHKTYMVKFPWKLGVLSSKNYTSLSACRPTMMYFSSASPEARPFTSWDCRTTGPTVFLRVDPRTDTNFRFESFYSEPTPTSSTAQASSTPPGTSKSAEPSTPTPTPTPTVESSPSETALEPQKSSSKSWIAGAVIGSLSFVCLAGLAFVFLHRRHNAHQPYQVAPQTSLSPKHGTDSFITALPPPMMNRDPTGQRLSESTVTVSGGASNTWSMYSAKSNGNGDKTPGGMQHASLQDLPELVPPKRRA